MFWIWSLWTHHQIYSIIIYLINWQRDLFLVIYIRQSCLMNLLIGRLTTMGLMSFLLPLRHAMSTSTWRISPERRRLWPSSCWPWPIELVCKGLPVGSLCQKWARHPWHYRWVAIATLQLKMNQFWVGNNKVNSEGSHIPQKKQHTLITPHSMVGAIEFWKLHFRTMRRIWQSRAIWIRKLQLRSSIRRNHTRRVVRRVKSMDSLAVCAVSAPGAIECSTRTIQEERSDRTLFVLSQRDAERSGVSPHPGLASNAQMEWRHSCAMQSTQVRLMQRCLVAAAAVVVVEVTSPTAATAPLLLSTSASSSPSTSRRRCARPRGWACQTWWSSCAKNQRTGSPCSEFRRVVPPSCPSSSLDHQLKSSSPIET